MMNNEELITELIRTISDEDLNDEFLELVRFAPMDFLQQLNFGDMDDDLSGEIFNNVNILTLAVFYDNIFVVNFLLARGLNINNDAVDLAINRENLDICVLLFNRDPEFMFNEYLVDPNDMYLRFFDFEKIMIPSLSLDQLVDLSVNSRTIEPANFILDGGYAIPTEMLNNILIRMREDWVNTELITYLLAQGAIPNLELLENKNYYVWGQFNQVKIIDVINSWFDQEKTSKAYALSVFSGLPNDNLLDYNLFPEIMGYRTGHMDQKVPFAKIAITNKTKNIIMTFFDEIEEKYNDNDIRPIHFPYILSKNEYKKIGNNFLYVYDIFDGIYHPNPYKYARVQFYGFSNLGTGERIIEMTHEKMIEITHYDTQSGYIFLKDTTLTEDGRSYLPSKLGEIVVSSDEVFMLNVVELL